MGGQTSDAFFQLSHQLLALPGGSLDPRCAFAARVLIADIGKHQKTPKGNVIVCPRVTAIHIGAPV